MWDLFCCVALINKLLYNLYSYGGLMKKNIILVIMFIIIIIVCLFSLNNNSKFYKDDDALYVHGISNSYDNIAWQKWQRINNQSKEYYFFLPSSLDDSKIEVYNSYSDSIYINNIKIKSHQVKTIKYDVNKSYKVKFKKQVYTLKILKSNAEVALYINNEDADGKGTDLLTYINSNKKLKSSADSVIVDSKGKVNNIYIKKIKGRGNSSFRRKKKSYNITFDRSISIDNMKSGKKYSLISNYIDNTLSRNRILYDLSYDVGVPYSPNSRYTDLYVNNIYKGSYLITEKIDVGKNSLINDIDDTNNKKDYSFLIELAFRVDDDEEYFETNYGQKVIIKYPDNVDDSVKKYVKNKFGLFYNKLLNNSSDLKNIADIDSISKLYLINELGKNWDCGISSLYFVYKKDSKGNYKFYGSPVWDYDLSLGNTIGLKYEFERLKIDDYYDYKNWWCMYRTNDTVDSDSNYIMGLIAKNKIINEHAKKIWFNEFVDIIDNSRKHNGRLLNFKDYYSLIKDSYLMNYRAGYVLSEDEWFTPHSLKKARYDYKNHKLIIDDNYTTYDTDFNGKYNYMIDWLVSRAAWISNEFDNNYDGIIS